MAHKFTDKLKSSRTLPGSYLANISNKNNLDKALNLRRTNSMGRFFERFRTKIFGKPLSITLEDDTPSELTIQERYVWVCMIHTSLVVSGFTVLAMAVDDFTAKLLASSYKPNKEKNHGGGCLGDGADMEKQDGCRASAFKCHLCNFCADRITLLDRHLLHEHKIGLEMLLKLVIAKTKTKDINRTDIQNGGRTPYYQHSNNVEDMDATSVFERIRGLPSSRKEYKTVGTNTVSWTSGISLKKSCDEVNEELEKLLSVPMDKYDHSTLLAKMSCINAVMSNIIESSNAAHLDTISSHGLPSSKHGLNASPRFRRTGSIRGLDVSPDRSLNYPMKRYMDAASIYGFGKGPGRRLGKSLSPTRGCTYNSRFDTNPIDMLYPKIIPSAVAGDDQREYTDFVKLFKKK